MQTIITEDLKKLTINVSFSPKTLENHRIEPKVRKVFE